MDDYLRGGLDYFLEEVTELPETLAATNLFNVREGNECEPLNKTRAQSFHHAVAQLLFTCTYCRMDAQTEKSFLKTRVRNLGKDDWKKLRRLLGYSKRTIKLPLILQANSVNVLKWWVDVSYAAHEDMWGHTIGTIPM